MENILRDRDYNWTLNYYKSDERSSCDPEISRMTLEIKERSSNIELNEKLKITLDENINTAAGKKIKKTLLEAWDKQYVQADEDILLDTNRIEVLQNRLLKWQWNRHLELGLESSLQRVRNRFMIDCNEELMRKGVTWACSYAEKNRYMLEFTIN